MDYEVLRDGWIAGIWRTKRETVQGTKSSMRYLELAGQVAEKKAAEQPAPAAAAVEEESAPVEQGGGRGKRK